MLINHEEKVIIHLPFKNYSTSLRTYFLEFDEWELLNTLHPTVTRDSYDNDSRYYMSSAHGNIPPYNFIRYKKILPLRNPYDRVISVWKWICRSFGEVEFNKHFYKGAKYPTSFPVSRTYPHDFVVRTENLKEDFEKYGINLDMDTFPHLNKHGSEVEHELTELEKEIIYWWHKEDFDAGNYEK